MLLCATGAKLADVGELIWIPKIVLPAPYTKSRMDILHDRNPALFKRYAMADALIVARFIPRLRRIAREQLGVTAPFATLAVWPSRTF